MVKSSGFIRCDARRLDLHFTGRTAILNGVYLSDVGSVQVNFGRRAAVVNQPGTLLLLKLRDALIFELGKSG